MLVVKYTIGWGMDAPDVTQMNILSALVRNLASPLFEVSIDSIEVLWTKAIYQVNSADIRVEVMPIVLVVDSKVLKFKTFMNQLGEALADNPHLPRQYRTIKVIVRQGSEGLHKEFNRVDTITEIA